MTDMEAQHEIERWRYDPFVPLNWRFQDATNLAAGKRMKWAHAEDSLVGDCAAYLQAMDSATTGRERVAVRARWPLSHAACELAEGTSLRRAEVQARLLASQTDEQIAERCWVQPELVDCFERLHFAVRRALKATDYLVMQTVGRAVHEGFKNDQVAEFVPESPESCGRPAESALARSADSQRTRAAAAIGDQEPAVDVLDGAENSAGQGSRRRQRSREAAR